MPTQDEPGLIWRFSPFTDMGDHQHTIIRDTPWGKLLFFADGDVLHIARYNGEAPELNGRRFVYILPIDRELQNDIAVYTKRMYGEELISWRIRHISPLRILGYKTHSQHTRDPYEVVLREIQSYRKKRNEWPSASDLDRLTRIGTYRLNLFLCDLERMGKIRRTKNIGRHIRIELTDYEETDGNS